MATGRILELMEEKTRYQALRDDDLDRLAEGTV